MEELRGALKMGKCEVPGSCVSPAKGKQATTM